MPPTLPLIPSSSTSSSSSSFAPTETANIRVLVRVRPHNHTELTERGSVGRTNVLTLDNNSKVNQSIDFNSESSKESNSSSSSSSSPTSATITVKGIDDNDVGNSSNSSLSGSTANVRRRMTTSSVGYTSDGDNGGVLINSSSNSYSKQFTFDAVHGPRSTQSEVYESVKGIVDAVVQGYNGTIVCYGQTGSGKTFTMCGGDGSDEAGLIQRSLRDIFQKITLSQAEEASGTNNDKLNTSMDTTNVSSTATFHGSFFEIFNERVYDLLSNNTALFENTSLAVREDAGGVYVQGLKEIQVTNTSEAEDLLNRGLSNRHVASTKMNRTSSRSHAVFVLSIKTEHVTAEGLRKVKNSKFTLVDLAGSERQKSTAAYGSRLKEASMINKSLLCLGHVINALVDKEAGRARHVPFRDSKLTFLLRDTWGGNSKTCLVAAVSPSGLALSETISTLKFAQCAKLIKNNAIMNEDTCGTVAALQAEVAKLRSELEKNTSEDNEDNVAQKRKATSTVFDANVVSAMKRRADRAEQKIAALEKLVSEERAVTKTLKRKLQGETMVRKFKERRLDFLQTKHQSNDRDEQVILLRNEIATLQQRLETPSAETIEWRVAYEQAKEELKKGQNSSKVDYEETKKRNEELESTVERLCTEKITLEERLAQVTTCSKETRNEIDSMINEVDRLENDMNRLQEQLNDEKSKSNELEFRANEAQSSLENVRTDHAQLIEEKTNLEFEVNVMKTKLESIQKDMIELEEKLKMKESEIIEVETLSRENELEFQCTIEELEAAINESKSSLKCSKESELELKQLLEEATKSVVNVQSELSDALNKIQEQQSAITGLEQKVVTLTNENDAVKSTIKKNKDTEATSNSNIEAMKQEIEQLNEEKANLNKRITCVKEQAKLTETALLDKTTSLDSCHNQIIELKGEHSEKMKLIQMEKHELQLNVSQLQHSIEQLEKSKCELESNQLLLDETNSNMKSLQDQILASENSQEELNNALRQKEEQIKQLEAETSHIKDIVLQKDSEIEQLQQSIQDLKQDSIHDMEEAEKKLQEIIDRLEVENKSYASNLQSLEQQLHNKVTEMEACLMKNGQYEDKMTQLREQNELLEKEQNRLLNEAERRESEVEKQFDTVKREKEEIHLQLHNARSDLQMKEKKILELAEQKIQSDKSLALIKESMASAEQEHSNQMKQMLSNKSILEAQIENLNDTIKISSQKHQDLEEIANDLQLRLDQNNEHFDKLKQEMNVELRRKDEEALRDKKDLESLLDQREKELSKLEREASTMKTEHSLHLKQHKESIDTTVELKKKIQTHQDRLILLKREKGHLEFEIDNLREDQDSLNDQVRTLARQNKSLLVENDQLKQTIETMKNEDLSMASISLSKASTFSNDTNLSYDHLSSEMDSMLGRISSKDTNDHSGSVAETNPLEDSFDESMFLPNVDEAATASNEQSNDKENSCGMQFSTPSKQDYGKKRQPLSERKMNKTPLMSFKKKFKSSTKKLRSSAKKDRTNYMMFNNSKLFGNK